MRNANADVPDLMQEVFLRLMRVENHEMIRNPQAYLYTVANHVLYQYTLRQAATSCAFELSEVAAELHALPELDPATEVEVEQRFEALGLELRRRFPKAYATLLLHRCEGLPLREIARRLSISHTMVKRHLARALSFCQQYLDELEEQASRR